MCQRKRVGIVSPPSPNDFDTTSIVGDTIFVVKYDTCRIYVPKIVEVKTKDTIYVKADTTLEVKSKVYEEEGQYKAWISGVEPLSLDSINFYNSTKQEQIVNTITRDRVINERKLFIGGGAYYLGNNVYPNIGITYKDKKNRLFSIEYSRIASDNVFGVTIKFAIN